MAESILKLKVDSQEYDSKIKRAVSGLMALDRNLKEAGKSLSDADKDAVKFAQELGKMETVSKSAKGKVSELSAAFIDMSSLYKKMSDQQKQSDIGKALAKSLEEMKNRTIEAKNELKEFESQLQSVGDKANSISMGENPLSGLMGRWGGLASGNMTMASFKGNLYAMAAEKGAEAIGQLKNKIEDIVKESMRMSVEAEGIRMAFDRLNRPDLLDKLKEATHGTVSEIELMKQAVKFNDFRLNLDDMGTLLAFAQQKAKDTGQSVDYMVDSIVTGLGRQSLMILDNLGLSAAEIKEKMKQTGDMTKAVAEIIRDQMSKAGDYVETAADRSARATVAINDEMLKLGDQIRDTFGVGGIEEFSNIIEVKLIQDLQDLVGVVGDVATGFGILDTDAGQTLRGILDVLYPVVREVFLWATGLAEVARLIHWIKGENPENAAAGGAGVGAAVGNYLAQNVLPEVVITPTKRPKGGGKSATADINSQITADFEKAMLKSNSVSSGFKVPEIFGPSDAWKAYTSDIRMGIEGIDDEMSNLTKWTKEFNPYNENLKKSAELAQQQATAQNLAAQSVANLGSALASLDDPAAKAAGTVMQAIANIALGFSAAATQAASLGPYGWIAYAAAGLSTMATVISSIHSLTGFAEGGVIKGNNYSGDNIGGLVDGNQFVGLNAGEIVLNQAQAGIIASRLQENGGGGMRVVGVLKGEDVVLMADRYGKRTGRGELAFWK